MGFLNRPATNQRLKPWHVAAALVVVGTAAQLAAMVAAVLAVLVQAAQHRTAGGLAAAPPMLPAWGMALAVLGSTVVLVVGSAGTAWLARVPVRTALGLRSPNPIVYVLACVAAVAASPVGGLFVGIARALAPRLTLGTMEAMNQQIAAVPIWFAIPVFALLPGISEETFFRGLLLRAVRRPWLAIALSGVLFAAYHVDPHHAAGTLPLGLLLAWIAWRTDSVLVTMAGHASFNLFAIVAEHLAGNEPQEPGLTMASVGVAAAGAVVSLGCAWAISRATAATEARTA